MSLHLLRRLLLAALLLALLAPLPAGAGPDEAGPANPPGGNGTGAGNDEPGDEKPPEIIRGGKDEPSKPDAATEPQAPEKPVFRKRTVEDEIPQSPLGVKAPPGMVYVPAGYALLGTPQAEIDALVAGQPDEVKQAFMYEAPQHRVPVDGFFMGCYEETNAQYYEYLKTTHAVEYETTGAHPNLDAVVGYLLHLSDSEVHGADIYARLLYLANKKVLQEAFPQLVVLPKQDPRYEDLTFQRIRHAPLGRGLTFHFYDRVPPIEWQGLAPPKEMLDHPVRSVSYLDAAEFAEWCGMHIPTEPEWEYAARGPEGYIYPWGDEWIPNAEKANWGGKVVDAHYNPMTVPVDANPQEYAQGWPAEQITPYDGMSWCGVYHMTGNVWEWTSTYFDVYAGFSSDGKGGIYRRYYPDYVKVLKGGGFSDMDPLALRLATRNFLGEGIAKPPVPGNRFKNVGFRLAWSGNPGQDRLEPVLYRATRGKRVKEEDLDLGRWVGASTFHFHDPTPPAAAATPSGEEAAPTPEAPKGSEGAPSGEDAGTENGQGEGEPQPAPGESRDPEGSKDAEGSEAAEKPINTHVYIDGKSLAVVVIPKKSLFSGDDEKSKVKRRDDLDKLTSGDADPLPLGVFHTDLAIEGVYVRDYKAQAAADDAGGRRRRRRPKAPPVEKGSVPPDTYILAVWWGRLCLTDTSLDFQCFLSPKIAPASQLRVERMKKDETLAPTDLKVTPVADSMEVSFYLPVGGKKNDEDLVVFVHWLPDTASGTLAEAGEWRFGRAANVPHPSGPPPAPPAAPGGKNGKTEKKGSGDKDK